MILNQERRRQYDDRFSTHQMVEYYNEQDEVIRERMLDEMNEDNDEFFKHRKYHILLMGISAFVGGMIVLRYNHRLRNIPIFRVIT